MPAVIGHDLIRARKLARSLLPVMNHIRIRAICVIRG